MKIYKSLAHIMGLILFVLAFQNCGNPTNVRFANTQQLQSSADGEGGSGQPYDGKIFILAGMCPDQSNVVSKVILTGIFSAKLVRKNCQDINPIVLASADFQYNPDQPDQLHYNNLTYQTETPTAATVVGTQIDLSSAISDSGYAYLLFGDFGGGQDTDADPYASKLQLFENGVPLGPPSLHVDIRNLGQGRYSHYADKGQLSLRLSASDNSDPRANKRIYSYINNR